MLVNNDISYEKLNILTMLLNLFGNWLLVKGFGRKYPFHTADKPESSCTILQSGMMRKVLIKLDMDSCMIISIDEIRLQLSDYCIHC